MWPGSRAPMKYRLFSCLAYIDSAIWIQVPATSYEEQQIIIKLITMKIYYALKPPHASLPPHIAARIIDSKKKENNSFLQFIIRKKSKQTEKLMFCSMRRTANSAIYNKIIIDSETKLGSYQVGDLMPRKPFICRKTKIQWTDESYFSFFLLFLRILNRGNINYRHCLPRARFYTV